MGVLPLQFTNGDTRETLKLSGSETVNITGIADGVTPGKKLQATVTYEDGSEKHITLLARIDTAGEAEYFRHGGILHFVLRQLAAA